MNVAQFYDVEENVAYANGWTFPEDCDPPEGDWVKVVSKRKVSLKTLAKKAKEIARLRDE